MILDKKVKIKITRKNIEYYKEFYENISLKDIIEVETETQLQNGSNLKVNVCCDICFVERYIKYQAYSKNINSCVKYPIYTCDKCSHIKLKEYNKDKYGVEYYSQHPDRNEKVKKTSIAKYGVDHFSKSINFREKVSKTNLDKFGYENPFMDSERIKSIFRDKYGVEHPSQVSEFYDKVKQTNIERTGYESQLSSPVIREKIKKTNNELYGSNSPMQSDLIRDCKITNNSNYIKYVDNKVSLFKCDNNLDHYFYIDSSSYHNRLRSNLKLCTVCNPIGDSRSIKEDELYRFILSIYKGEVVKSYRDKLEIDIYLPEIKLGFEFNGLYWHSEKLKDKNYHSDKTKYFFEKDIRIIHIWEDDWSFNCNIVKSQIKNWLGKTDNKIWARKCEVVQLKSVSNFLEDNHIQGVDQSSLKLGLIYNKELVSVMTFNNFEGRKRMEDSGWNLSRFCNKIETNVVGGASKLLKYFIKNYKPIRIVSYADRDWSIGNLYYKLGFNNINESLPDYKYVVNNKRVHKSNFKKSKLKYSCTEKEYITSMGVDKIWDCGKIKFELNI